MHIHKNLPLALSFRILHEEGSSITLYPQHPLLSQLTLGPLECLRSSFLGSILSIHGHSGLSPNCTSTLMCLFLTLSVCAAPKQKPYIFISASGVSKHHIAGLTTIFYTAPFTPVDDFEDHSHLCPFDRIEKNKLYLSVTNVQIKTDLKTIDEEHTSQ